MLEKEYLHLDGVGEAWRLQGYRSKQSLFDDPTCDDERLRTCFLQRPIYPVDPVEITSTEKDLSRITDVEFWNHKKNTNSARIFEKMNKLVVEDQTGLNLFINKEVKTNNLYRLDFAFRRTAGQQVTLGCS